MSGPCSGDADLAQAGRLNHSGDVSRLVDPFAILDGPDPALEIVLP